MSSQPRAAATDRLAVLVAWVSIALFLLVLLFAETVP